MLKQGEKIGVQLSCCLDWNKENMANWEKVQGLRKSNKHVSKVSIFYATIYSLEN